MSEKVQVGLRVDRDVYEEFKQNVEERKGRWQGVGGEELENAMRHYIKFGSEKPLPDMLAEFNGRLQRIEGAVGVAESDGGTDTLQTDPYTHAPTDESYNAPDEKPAANAATDKKLAWLAEQLIQDEVPNTREIQEIPRDKIRSHVVESYGFRKDTAKRYVEMLIDEFGFVSHPKTNNLLVTEERKEELIRSEVSADD